jgi:hypothetical protein
VNDYGISDDGVFSAVDIKLLDADSEADLEGQIYNDKPTLFRARFTTTATNLTNVWAIHRLYELNSQGNNLIAELSSILAYPDDNPLLPIDGQTQLYLYLNSGDIVSECLIDNTKIDASKQYRLTARIDRASEVFIFSTVFNQAISGTFTASVTNSVTGAWLLGGAVISGNSLSTNNVYLDGALKLVKYTASSFAGLTAINIDDTQARGTLDLSNPSFTSLLTVSAQNNLFDTVLFGTWVQTTLVDIDLTNSVITVDVLTLIIDNLIIANGGTTTDDGVNYTGSAGVTAAGRTLAVGTITIDITTTGILYEKILALIAVGWNITTINTVCLKNRVFNSDLQDFITWTVDDNFFEIVSIDYIDADSLIVAYYDTIANAIAGTATGRLALGQSAVNTYLSTTGWASGEAIRIYNALGDPLQTATINYKATPLAGVPCGLQPEPYVSGNAKIYDGVFDSDSIAGWTEFNTTQPFTLLGVIDIDSLAGNPRIFSTRRTAPTNKGFQHGFVADGRIFAGFVANGTGPRILQVLSTGAVTSGSGLLAYAITFDGGGNLLGQFTIKANNSLVASTRTATLLGGDTVVNGTATATIGNSNIVGFANRFDGLIRKFQIVDTDYSQTPALQAILDEALQVGSFEGLVDDARFLFDVDFNKTSGNLTTRSGTPLKVITANGGEAYTKFIP